MDFNVREKTLTTTAASKNSSRVSSLSGMFPPPQFLQGVQFVNYQKEISENEFKMRLRGGTVLKI